MSHAEAIRKDFAERFGEEISVDADLSGLDEIARIAGHRVHRRYDGRPIDPALLRLLCACALSAPSKSDLQQRDIVVVENPQLAFSYDTDGQQAVASRLRVFDMLASQRIPSITYHFPWPGIGNIGKQGSAYRYYPAMMQTAL